MNAPITIELSELPPLCTLKEAAGVLRCTTRTVQTYIAAGRLRAARIDSGSSRLLIPRVELERLVQRALQ